MATLEFQSHSFGIISDQLYKAAMVNCNGDYINPTNKPCTDVVKTINDLISQVNKEGILDQYVSLLHPNQGEMLHPNTID